MSTRAACARRVVVYAVGVVGAAGLWMILSVLLGATSAHADEAAGAEPEQHGSISEVVDRAVRQGARRAADAASTAARDVARVVTAAVPQASPVTEPVVDRVVDPVSDGVTEAADTVGSELVEATATVEHAVEDLSAEVLPAEPEKPVGVADPAGPAAAGQAAAGPGGQGRGVAGILERAGSGDAGHLLTGSAAGDPVVAEVPGLHQGSSAHPTTQGAPRSSIEPLGSAAPLSGPCSAAAASSAPTGSPATAAAGLVPALRSFLEPVFWGVLGTTSAALVSAPDGLPACTPD